MSILNERSTKEEIENFLLYHMDSADGEKAKINPSLTKEQVWNLYMGKIVNGDITRIKGILIKNITQEFGEHYGD